MPAIAAAQVGQTGNAPMQSLPNFPGHFAIDGFMQRQGANGDWLAAPIGSTNNFIFSDNGTPLIPLAVRVIDKYNTASDDVFAKGHLQDDPNTMKWTLRKATSKTDLNNVLVVMALNPADNHIWLALGADRRSTGRNSSIDLELLQLQALMTGDINSNNDKGFYSAGPHRGRTVGDLVISVTFQNNDVSSTSIQYWQWQPGAQAGSYAYFPINPPAGTAFTATNATPLASLFRLIICTPRPPRERHLYLSRLIRADSL
jgi:hypothetical protein